jgi:hypothetical protein
MRALPNPPAGTSELADDHLGALVGRLMPSGTWVTGARHAGAEPIWTGRSRPYDESTLRKRAHEFADHGGTELVVRAVEATVANAVKESGEKAVAYTDMFDQVYWTKKPAYAAPIGNRGNRLLAATYFGLTFVRPSNSPALAYSISWHKPASPLQDALEALHAEPRRGEWLTHQIGLHIWDRGGSGRPTLRWALRHGIPYLTLDKKATHWTRYRRPPRVHTRSRVPVFTRRDSRLTRGSPRSSRPEEVIFPAKPDKGRKASKALRYHTGAPLPSNELRTLDRVYKTRWPCNENPIKALIAVGLDRNLDRGLTPTTSRGTDGRLGRLEARERVLRGKIDAFKPATISQAIREARPLLREKRRCAKQRAAITAMPITKGARMAAGAELLCKSLMLLMYNMLLLLLGRSTMDAVKAMTPWRVYQLLLGRNALVTSDEHTIALWVDPVVSALDRRLQDELVRLIDARGLSLRGRSLHLRVREPPG